MVVMAWRMPVVLLALVLLVPPVQAVPGGVLIVVGPDTVQPGETRDYRDGLYVVAGDVVVRPGGSILFDNADVNFLAGPHVITLEPGATLVATDTTFRSDLLGDVLDRFIERRFAFDVQEGASFTLEGSIVRGAATVAVATSDTHITDTVFEYGGVGLALSGVDVELAGLVFTNNGIGLTASGGSVHLAAASFTGNPVGFRAEGTNVTLDGVTIVVPDIVEAIGFAAIGMNVTMTNNVFTGPGGSSYDKRPAWISEADEAVLTGNQVSGFSDGMSVHASPVVATGNSFVGPADYTRLLSIWVRDDEASASLVADNLFENGSMDAGGDPAYSSIVVRENTAIRGSLYTGYLDAEVRDNTVFDGWISTNGPAYVHNNTVVGDFSTAGSIAAWGGPARVEDNAVFGGWSCFHIEQGSSARNTAVDCGYGFSLVASTSVDDFVSGGQESAAGFSLYGDHGLVERAMIDGMDRGIAVQSDAGGWLVVDTAVTGSRIGIQVQDGTKNVTFRDTEIRDSTEYGIWQDDGALYLYGVGVFGTNGTGIHVEEGTVTGSGDWIGGNVFGVDLGFDGFAILPGSYWNDPSGPTVGSNPGGTGEAIHHRVIYTDFLTAPPWQRTPQRS